MGVFKIIENLNNKKNPKFEADKKKKAELTPNEIQQNIQNAYNKVLGLIQYNGNTYKVLHEMKEKILNNNTIYAMI